MDWREGRAYIDKQHTVLSYIRPSAKCIVSTLKKAIYFNGTIEDATTQAVILKVDLKPHPPIFVPK